MPCPFTGPNFFCSGPNSLGKTKIFVAFSAAPKYFVLAQKMNLI